MHTLLLIESNGRPFLLICLVDLFLRALENTNKLVLWHRGADWGHHVLLLSTSVAVLGLLADHASASDLLRSCLITALVITTIPLSI